MKIGGTVKALLVLFVVLSCTTQDDPASIGLLADSASYDLLKYNFLAYHQTHDEVTVVDQIYPDLDTIRLDNKSIRLFKTYGPPDEEFEVVGAHFLLVKECDRDRKSTRLNSSHVKISYAVFCLKKKNNK